MAKPIDDDKAFYERMEKEHAAKKKEPVKPETPEIIPMNVDDIDIERESKESTPRWDAPKNEGGFGKRANPHMSVLVTSDTGKKFGMGSNKKKEDDPFAHLDKIQSEGD